MWDVLYYERTGLSFAIAVGPRQRSHNHILWSQIRDFLSVASHDSQGYGGGIRPRGRDRIQNLFYSEQLRNLATSHSAYCHVLKGEGVYRPFPGNALNKSVVICYCRSKIFESCHIFKGSISYLRVMFLPCVLVSSHAMIMRIIATNKARRAKKPT
jgi:hypothetical protein